MHQIPNIKSKSQYAKNPKWDGAEEPTIKKTFYKNDNREF